MKKIGVKRCAISGDSVYRRPPKSCQAVYASSLFPYIKVSKTGEGEGERVREIASAERTERSRMLKLLCLVVLHASRKINNEKHSTKISQSNTPVRDRVRAKKSCNEILRFPQFIQALTIDFPNKEPKQSITGFERLQVLHDSDNDNDNNNIFFIT